LAAGLFALFRLGFLAAMSPPRLFTADAAASLP
jgi:hypothetical protein